MSPTIKLNSKTGIMAVEVYYISTNRILSAELEPAETTSPQDIPEQVFRVSLSFAKLSRKDEQLWWY